MKSIERSLFFPNPTPMALHIQFLSFQKYHFQIFWELTMGSSEHISVQFTHLILTNSNVAYKYKS